MRCLTSWNWSKCFVASLLSETPVCTQVHCSWKYISTVNRNEFDLLNRKKPNHSSRLTAREREGGDQHFTFCAKAAELDFLKSWLLGTYFLFFRPSGILVYTKLLRETLKWGVEWQLHTQIWTQPFVVLVCRLIRFLVFTFCESELRKQHIRHMNAYNIPKDS